MTKRERLLALLKGQKPDILPWYGDLAYWFTYLNRTGRMPEKYHTEDGIYRLQADLGVGFHLQGFYPFTTHYEGVDVKTDITNDITTTVYSTPAGTLTERWRYIPETFSKAPAEHLVKDIDDLAALRYLYEHTYYLPDNTKIAKHREYVGDNGITVCYSPRTPFMELVVLKAGINALTFCIADDPEEFEATLDVIGKNFNKAFDITIATDCDCIMVPENLSSEMVGKEYYRRYMESYHQDWSQKIKDKGKYSMVHMDGTLKGLLNEVSHSGFDILEALTPAPVGDIPLEDFASYAPDNVILWGGLPGAFFSDDVSDGDFDKFTIEAIKYMSKNPRFVLGVADQVPPHTSFERIQRVNKLVEEYGAY